MNAKGTFTRFAEQGTAALDIIRKTSYSPNSSKSLKKWGITDVSEMIDRSVTYIRQQEKEKKIPEPLYENNKRVYSLEEINNLRIHFNTKKGKGNGDTCIICFSNFKGGAAKTTSSISAAQYFAMNGYNVLFIDCDSQASATQVFGYIPDQDIGQDETILPYLTGTSSSLDSVIKKTYWAGLDLIPSNLALYNAEFIIPIKCSETSQKKDELPYNFYSLLSEGIQKIKHKYDIIILDCPPSLGMISINAIYSSNAIIIPTPSSMLDFTSTIQFFFMLKETFSKLPEKKFDFIKIMITKHDGRESSNTIVKILRQLYGDYVMHNIMNNSEVIKKASASMQTIYEIEKYEGSKKTLERALQYTNSLNDELEKEILAIWNFENRSNEEIL